VQTLLRLSSSESFLVVSAVELVHLQSSLAYDIIYVHSEQLLAEVIVFCQPSCIVNLAVFLTCFVYFAA